MDSSKPERAKLRNKAIGIVKSSHIYGRYWKRQNPIDRRRPPSLPHRYVRSHPAGESAVALGLAHPEREDPDSRQADHDRRDDQDRDIPLEWRQPRCVDQRLVTIGNTEQTANGIDRVRLQLRFFRRRRARRSA